MEIRRLHLLRSGHPEYETAAVRLEAVGFEIVTAPPEPEDAREWGPWARYALALLVSTDGVALVRGSGATRGASLLCQTAHELAMPVRTLRAWLTKSGQDAYMSRLTGERP